MAMKYRGSVITLVLCIFFYIKPFAQAQTPTPFEAKWSGATFGPDGPWQAVEVTLGKDSKVALYPGHTYQSFVIGTNYCKFNTSNGCYASKAGTYNRAQASEDGTGSASQIQYRPPLRDWMAGMDIQGDLPEFWVDRMILDSPDGDQHTVHDTSLTLIESQMFGYPSGKWYPAFAGCLGIGAPGTVNMSFSTETFPINASLVPGMMWFANRIPSNSFSMHIGSVASRLSGSLWFGGYDRNRVVGDVLVTNEDFNQRPVTLKDISIDVIRGASPFDFSTQDGLLATGNGTITSGLRVTIDGCAPYLTLPKSTCDNIASHLPVTYDSGLGLYLWETNSPKYSQIISSASTLSFTFLTDSNTKTLTIRVPFAHLNLTLSEPLVESPVPYFPCFTGGSGSYNLGRAFLQDAFLGANWGQSKWWLAQAPGPNIQLSPSVSIIAEEDMTIKAGNNDWEESWKGAWKVLTDDEANSTTPVEPPLQTSTSSPDAVSSDSSQVTPGLSTGAKAGIGAASGALVLVLIGSVVFCRRHRPKKREDSAWNSAPPQYEDNNLRLQLHMIEEPYKGPVEVYGSSPVQTRGIYGGDRRSKANGTMDSRVELP